MLKFILVQKKNPFTYWIPELLSYCSFLNNEMIGMVHLTKDMWPFRRNYGIIVKWFGKVLKQWNLSSAWLRVIALVTQSW